MELIVFLSPGRCGTQFFATYLRDAAGDRAVVRHEPLRAQYAPKLTLRAPDLDRLLPSYPPVQRHFEMITRIIEAGRVYVETGWPGSSPGFRGFWERFGDQALAVHLTRNPIRFAFSLASHGFSHRSSGWLVPRPTARPFCRIFTPSLPSFIRTIPA